MTYLMVDDEAVESETLKTQLKTSCISGIDGKITNSAKECARILCCTKVAFRKNLRGKGKIIRTQVEEYI